MRLGTASSQQQRDVRITLSSYYGVPNLDTFYTSDAQEAGAFLDEWRDESYFGLYIRVVPSRNRAFFPVRVVLLAICHGTRVLVFDLRPWLREVPSPMPGPVADFLQDRRRIFFGMDLKRSAGRLAFELDTVIRCLDFNVRAWPELRRGGGLYGVFNRYVSLDIDLWRPETLKTLSSQGRHAYLQWSVAHYFLMFHGPVQEDWIVTKAEFFEAGPVYLRVAEPKHDWSLARDEWKERRQQRAALSIRRSLQAWRRRERQKLEQRRLAGETVWISDEAMEAALALPAAEGGWASEEARQAALAAPRTEGGVEIIGA